MFPVGARAPVTALDAPVVIGRDGDCDVALSGQRVSRRHAEISVVGPLRVLRDLGSMNGTFLDGVRVREAPLPPGAVVRIGDHLALACLAPSALTALSFQRFAPDLLGGPALARIMELARQAAAGPLPVVIEGETGTGKEKMARALHALGGRQGAFVAVNCAALPRELLAAQLFGWRRGAFTGADRSSPGFFQDADGGTLLLDELADLPLETQGALLRAIQEREVVPLGDARPVPVDVKLVVATQIPLAQLAADGLFRRDLQARLDCWNLRLPPLAERREDIPFVVTEKIRAASGLDDLEIDVRLMEALLLYSWPLNLRELDNVARRLAAVARPGLRLGLGHLPETFSGGKAPAPTPPPATAGGSSRFHRAFRPEDVQALNQALEATQGNLAEAARALGISRNRAYRVQAAARRVESAGGAQSAAGAQDDGPR